LTRCKMMEITRRVGPAAQIRIILRDLVAAKESDPRALCEDTKIVLDLVNISVAGRRLLG
jgi:hypothetical protein